MKKFVSFLSITVMTLGITLVNVSPGSSGSLIYQQTGLGNPINPATLPEAFRISTVEATIDSDNPDLLVLRVFFPSLLKSDSFVPYTTKPLLRIKIFKKWKKDQSFDAGYGDIFIENPIERYPYQNQQLSVPIYQSSQLGGSYYDNKTLLQGCVAKTWIDPSGQNLWLKFAVSMTCIKLPDKFAVIAYADADLNNSWQIDSKYAPAIPMEVDLTSVARPRLKDEQILRVNQIQTVDLRTTSLSVYATNTKVNLFGEQSAGNPIQYVSASSSVCAFDSSNSPQLRIISKGQCIIQVSAAGDATTQPAVTQTITFTVNPRPQAYQSISWYEPYDIFEDGGDFTFDAESSSRLPVAFQSNSPDICRVFDPVNKPLVITPISSGYCYFTLTQPGNEDFYPANSVNGRFFIEKKEEIKPTPTPTPDGPSKPSPSPSPPVVIVIKPTIQPRPSVTARPTKVSTTSKPTAIIICVKGKVEKKISGSKCPPGYTRKKS